MKSSIIKEIGVVGVVGVVGVQTSLSTQELIALKDLTESIVKSMNKSLSNKDWTTVDKYKLSNLLNFVDKLTDDVKSSKEIADELFAIVPKEEDAIVSKKEPAKTKTAREIKFAKKLARRVKDARDRATKILEGQDETKAEIDEVEKRIAAAYEAKLKADAQERIAES
jgi:hypothetical protein